MTKPQPGNPRSFSDEIRAVSDDDLVFTAVGLLRETPVGGSAGRRRQAVLAEIARRGLLEQVRGIASGEIPMPPDFNDERLKLDLDREHR